MTLIIEKTTVGHVFETVANSALLREYLDKKPACGSIFTFLLSAPHSTLHYRLSHTAVYGPLSPSPVSPTEDQNQVPFCHIESNRILVFNQEKNQKSKPSSVPISPS